MARRDRLTSPSFLIDCFKTTIDAELCFERLFKRSACSFWLDSSSVSDSLGRYSYMGDSSGPRARVATANVAAGAVTIRDHAGVHTVKSSLFDWLKADLLRYDAIELTTSFGFKFGWVGYLGYELKADCRGQLIHHSKTPDAAMIFADRLVVFDHHEGAVYFLTLADPETRMNGEQWLRATRQAIEDLERGGASSDEIPLLFPIGSLTSRHDQETYLRLIRESQNYLLRGESYQICLTNQLVGKPLDDPWLAYRRLRRNNPVPFGALLKLDQLWILSSSPERFLQISDRGAVESKPIKGTRPRSSDSRLDRNYREELLSSEKERAENLMIVDLVRNDLGRHAAIGSVHVPKLFDVESYASVHQLVSTVRAQLRPDCTAIDCVRAAFPGGSMTGAPKIRTMQIIDNLESGPRGVYSGALGYFSLSGAIDLSIVIRTLVVTPHQTSYGVGGAITVLSDPDDEFEETVVKAAPLLQLCGGTFPR
jgi:para-aminobenzoate synthetase